MEHELIYHEPGGDAVCYKKYSCIYYWCPKDELLAKLEQAVRDLFMASFFAQKEFKRKIEGKAEKKAKKTRYGHVKTAISGQIDKCLLEKKMTIAQIAKACGCKNNRVSRHITLDLKTGMRNNGIAAKVVQDGSKYFIV